MTFIEIPTKTIRDIAPGYYLELLMKLQMHDITLEIFGDMLDDMESSAGLDLRYDVISSQEFEELHKIYTKLQKEVKKKFKIKVILTSRILKRVNREHFKHRIYSRVVDPNYVSLVNGHQEKWSAEHAVWMTEVVISDHLKKLGGTLVTSA